MSCCVLRLGALWNLNHTQSNFSHFQKEKAVDDHRRKWDKEEYEQLARERIEAEQRALLEGGKKEAPVRRELLKPRDYKVSF